MNIWLLLILVTMFYAGYNILVKVSVDHALGTATTTILATISLQLAALSASLIFAIFLYLRGGHVFTLPTASFGWAILAGICIGGAEIGYFYLFSGFGLRQSMPASVAIPVVVSGTIVISVLLGFFLMREDLGWQNLMGTALLCIGMFLIISK